MKIKFLIASIACLSMLSTTSCKKDVREVEPTACVEQNENGSIELFPNAKVVSPTDVKLLTSITNDKLVFSGSSDFLENLKVGDILIAPTSDIAPDGYLRVINQIDKNVNSYVFYTSNSSLEKAIKHGKIKLEFPVMFDANEDLETGKTTGYSGTTSKTWPTNYVMYDKDLNLGSTNDQIRLDGSFTMSASMSVDMNFSWGDLTYFDMRTTIGSSTTQTLTIGASAAISTVSRDKIFYEMTSLPSITFYVGAVPIVIKPIPSLRGNISGKANGAIKFSLNGSASITPRLVYTKANGWKTYFTKTTNFSGIKPAASVSADFTARTGPRFTFALYGCQSCASAFLEGNVYAKAEISFNPSFSKKLTAGLRAGAGATLLGKNVAFNPFYTAPFITW